MAEETKRCEYSVSVSLLRHGLTRLDGSPVTEIRCDYPATRHHEGRDYCLSHWGGTVACRH